VFASPAQAAVVPCGAVLTTSTVLTADVGPCGSGIAIELAADNITLDLNGHTVLGTGTTASFGIGVHTFGTTGDVIKNGTITKFDSGIFLEEANHVTVTGTRLVDNIGPDSSDTFGEGLQIYQGGGHILQGNQVVHNGPFAGMVAYQTSNNTIDNNQVVNNNILDTSGHHGGGDPIMQDIGIWVVNLVTNPIAAQNNTVTRNQATGNGLDGIQVARLTNNNLVQNNMVANNGFGQPAANGFRDGDGIANFGSFNRILSNSSTHNGANGVGVYRAVNGSGVPIGGQSNTVRSNAATTNGTGVHSAGVAFDLTDTNLTPPCDSNTWAANIFLTRSQVCIS
jgi:parallel beta-helix repeat protein